MTPAQEQNAFGQTTVVVELLHYGGTTNWHAQLQSDNVECRFYNEHPIGNDDAARRHASEFFKKLGLKVRFGK